jgi:DNA-directed RNA polymerase specialized sigma24 family protein
MESKHTLLQTVRQYLTDLYTFTRRIVESDEQAEEIILKTLNQLINQSSPLLSTSDVKVSIYAILYQNMKKMPDMELENIERQTKAHCDFFSLFNCLDPTHKSASQKLNVLGIVSEDEVKNLIHQMPRSFRVCYLLSLFADFSPDNISVITGLSVAEISVRIFEANRHIHTGLWRLLKEKSILVE